MGTAPVVSARTLPSVPTAALAAWGPCGGAADVARAAALAERYRRTQWTALELVCLHEVSSAERARLAAGAASAAARADEQRAQVGIVLRRTLEWLEGEGES